MANQTYTIREAKDTEKEETFHLIYEYHTPEAVLTQGFLRKNKDRMTPQIENLMKDGIRQFIKNNACLVAVDNESKRIIGAIVLHPHNIPRPETRVPPPKGKTLNLVEELSECLTNMHIDSKFYEKYPKVQQCIDLRSMCVHKDHRGKGLAKVLLKESIKWGKTHNFELLYGYFALPASRGAAKSVGFNCILEYDLNKARGYSTDLAFADVSPNNIASIMVYELKNE